MTDKQNRSSNVTNEVIKYLVQAMEEPKSPEMVAAIAELYKAILIRY